MKRRFLPIATAFLALATSIAAVTGSAPALGQARGDFGAVWCHDAERDALSRVIAEACKGRIVDESEAQRLNQARADRVKKVIGDLGPRTSPPSWVAPAEPGSPRPRVSPPRGTPGDLAPPQSSMAPQPDATAGRMPKGSGTGFFLNETGAVLTNFHVAGSCGAITVTGFDRRPIVARVAASAAAIDLLVLSTASAPLAVAPFSRDPARSGSDRALLVGFSLKGQPTTTATPSSARIKPTDLATDAWRVVFNGRAYPGHSGSPLLNQFGEVVAVVHARATSKTVLAGGAVESHSGLAVSMRATRQFLADSKISFQSGPADRSFSDEQILERARRFVVRVQCWS